MFSFFEATSKHEDTAALLNPEAGGDEQQHKYDELQVTRI